MCWTIVCYDFDSKELTLILPKDINFEMFGGYKDKVYFIYNGENTIISLDINTMELDEYYDKALGFLIRDGNIYIINGAENSLVIKNLDSNTEKIVPDFSARQFLVSKDNILFVENRIIYRINLTTDIK